MGRMSEADVTDPGTALGQLSDDAKLVSQVLQEEGGPLDVIAISSRTRLPIERVMVIVQDLVGRGLAKPAEPEPVHERFTPSGPLQPA
jgi:hypothetical protein